MFEFTKKTRKILEISAQNEGKRLNSHSLGPEHILLALLKDDDSVAARIMKNIGVDFSKTIFLIEKNSPKSNDALGGEKIPMGQGFKNVIEMSRDEAQELKNSYIGTEHLLLAVFKEGSCPGLTDLDISGINYEILKDEILRVLGVRSSSKPFSIKKENKKSEALREFTTDLTELAARGKLDPVIGRDGEIARVVRILSRRRKNNPILIGEAGVGKTSIVEGLAQRIVREEVPPALWGNRVLALDLSSVVAGTKYRGDFEERLKRLVDEIGKTKGIILFIDEIHTITGAGSAEGGIDAANILKPALARGEMQCIGATTLGEYKLYIERDSALVRRFQNIVVEEPDFNATLEILKGVRGYYEDFHKVKYTDAALEESVFLAGRYINDRNFPDKAMDVLDEAGSMAKYDNIEVPSEIVQLEEEIGELNDEKIALVQGQAYEEAARVRDVLSEKKALLKQMNDDWMARANVYELVVEPEVVGRVVADMTGVPVEEIEEDEFEKLLSMESYIQERLVGQTEAINIVCNTIRRARVGFSSPNRPTGSFLFLGPSGVGKTEMVRALAEFLFDDERSMVRLDMSEYMEKHTVSRLIGSPPGYVGYEEGGQLTEKIKLKPYSIVLLDEIEKAHRDVINILLQILDEGELTDSSGTIVSFRDCIIMMTSNLGTSKEGASTMGFSRPGSEERKKQDMEQALKAFFSPELLNRIDEVVFFNDLEEKEMIEIAGIMLRDLSERLDHSGVRIEFSPPVKKYFAHGTIKEKGTARMMRRKIQKEIEDEVAMLLLHNRDRENLKVQVSLRGGKISCTINSSNSSRSHENLKELESEGSVVHR